ncbi:MAG: hypothetical protein HC840_31495 [Leptolyngbyaceae cyanobacterium RM2_2_4]|nr:hypothetical protein [Leptolyngbyaceae cyanobacterium SM1_4_3]NJN91411.1 hypothetical protein [Leptolyngbyaceae cyanobacterium SL_5_14]NJO53179.1 hypothetical protein [Leptolyngbyaceae cyanobacterium RM2_2_4]
MTSPPGQQNGWTYWRWYISATAIALLISIPLIVLMAILFSPLIAFLWNSLMPSLFGLKQINWTQAIGLFVLARLLLSTK